MNSAKTSRLPRTKTIAIYGASATSIVAAIAASSLLMSGCVPCTDPNGCSSGPKPFVAVTLSPGAGTYAGQQMVSIAAPNAVGIYFSTDGTTPNALSCAEWDGNPIPINDSTVLRVFAEGDVTNYRSRAVVAEYKLTAAPYTNRTALNGWIQLEKDALAALYCANNACTVPPATILQNEFHWTADCPQGGSVMFDNEPATLTTTFTYVGCAANGVAADGAVMLTLDATKLPAISITGSEGVTLNGSGYTASIADQTVRKYSLSGTEGDRAGSYDVNCVGAGCAAGEVNYYYGKKNALWIKDPAVPNSCTP